ncbi:MAG TPA: peptidyl-alpha-hydroxyglycine alpha-amidating lyase family protein [Xanthobacteraceae bacterium]|nr:peptidyl-alpha-hydroxyglycine alpha-amidating lyase family protein [Xanthobacteraceae bacterium]
MREHARMMLCAVLIGAAAAVAAAGPQARAEDPNSAPNPYHVLESWAKLPQGRVWGMAIGVDIDRDGTSVWVFDRCGAKTCEGSNIAPIQKFDASGRLVVSFGSGLFNWPHGLFADRDGTIWVTDGKGQTVTHLAPDGRVLMTLGKPNVAGDGPDTFNSPSDVVVAPNGDIFVADGHGEKTNARIVKFDKGGKFIKAWGSAGAEPGQFNVPHGLAMDSAGRLFVADRSNNRIQIFDQDGKFLAEWKQFGRPSGVYIRDDILYVADSQSSDKVNAPFKQGIRIGSVKDGKVTAFISAPDPKIEMPEGLAADKDGNIFGGFTANMDLKKFVKN